PQSPFRHDEVGTLRQMQRLYCDFCGLSVSLSDLSGQSQIAIQEDGCNEHLYQANSGKSKSSYRSPPIGRRLMTFLIAYLLGYVCCFWAWSNFDRGRRFWGWMALICASVLTISFTWLFLLTVAPWTWDWWW